MDTIVVGAGTAGAVVAGRLAAGSSERTLLPEAGPDYGPAGSGRWPHDLLDAASAAQWSHDWGYTGEFGGQVIHFNRARVVGGCSAHNAGAVVFGSRLDYDGWAAAGNPGWSARELLPLFASAWKQLRVRRVGLDELTPFQRISGIGPASELIAIGVKPVLDLPGVGRNLHDQPCLEVGYEGSGDLIEHMERHQAGTGWRPDEQVIAKFPSAPAPNLQEAICPNQALAALAPSPVVELNRAVAVAMADGPERGLQRAADCDAAQTEASD